MENQKRKYDIALIGGGIMSATLAILIKELMPEASLVLFERLPKIAEESSSAWNNAGTGHSAFCELNYTPELENGQIDITKALRIAEQFEVSKQFWTYLIKTNKINSPQEFIQLVPHCSLVFGTKDVAFLKKRFELLSKESLFEGMEFVQNGEIIQKWMPLIMEGRESEVTEIAATKMDIGTDVNYGSLSNKLVEYIENQKNNEVYLNHNINDIDANKDGTWEIEVENLANGIERKVDAKFVFVGAGGGALKLLNKAKIDEVDGFGGFPVGGKWLRCKNEEIIEKHYAKVYGKAEIGAPPMSVPHLDTRQINGKRELLFGPYAGFNTKFLKNGSYWDLPSSLDTDNFWPMIEAGINNMPLTKYLIDQVQMTFDEKLDALRKYYPKADAKDWELIEAGQRVQVIKKNEDGDGVIEFGTELIINKEKTISGLLGASPGASTAVSIMLKLIEKCFSSQFNTIEWQNKLKEIFPSYGKELNANSDLLNTVRTEAAIHLFKVK